MIDNVIIQLTTGSVFMSRKVKLNQQFYTRANLEPKTLNTDERTVDVVFTTSKPVIRFGWDGPYNEVLSMDPDHARMEWINSGKAPVLDNHNARDSIRNILGVVKKGSGELSGKKALATAKFSKRKDVDDIIQDVKDGIIGNISVGYQVYKYEDISKKGDEIPTYKATDWEPKEISFVTIPADSDAGVRSLDESYDCEIINHENKDNEMTVKKTPVEAEIKVDETRSVDVAPVVAAPVVDVDKVKKEAAELARADELKRFDDIKNVCQKAGLEQAEADAMYRANKTVDQAREAALEILAERSNKEVTNGVHVEVGKDNAREHRIIGAADALLHRSNSAKYKMTDQGKGFYYMSMLDLAKNCLEGVNVDTKMLSPSEIAERAFHSTSDFPIILENVLNKSLRAGYSALPRTFEPFIRQRPMRDFKVHKSLQKGPAPQLLLKGEGSEITAGTITEGSEEYQLQSYARKIRLTRETIINDDLSAFSNLPADLGNRIADLENDLFWTLITTPQTMADGNALFHATHANLGATAGKPSIVTLNEARQLGREQLDIDGERRINIELTHLVVAPEDETVAQQLVVDVQGQAFAPATVATLNPFAGRLSVIVEPRLADAGTQPFYVFANAGLYPMAEKGILQGQEGGPQTSSYIDNDTKGVSFDIMYDVVFHVIDSRPFVKMPGA